LIRFTVLLAGLLFVWTSALAMVVREIRIEGLRSTRPWVIERELTFAVGDSVTEAELRAAERRLLNLQAFNEVTVRADSAGTVKVDVSEAWPILPIFGMSLAEGDLGDAVENPRSFWQNVSCWRESSTSIFRETRRSCTRLPR